MQSTTVPALQFYSNIAQNPTLLAQGYPLITQYLAQNQQNRKDTLLNLLHPSVPVFSLVVNVYPQEIFGSDAVQNQEKDSTIDFLLKMIVTELLKPKEQYKQKQVGMLFDFMTKIHNVQGYERWVTLYIQSLVCLSQNKSDRFGQFLVNTLRYADDRVSVLTQELLPHLISYEFSQKEDEKLEIYYYILKSLAFKVDSDPEAIQKHVSPYLETIKIYALTNMKKSIECLKFSLKLLTLMFGDYEQNCTSQIQKQLQLTAEYLIRQYLRYLNSETNSQDYEDQEAPIYVALYQMMELTSILLSNQVKINIERSLYFCIVCTFLTSGQYKNYITYSDQYLMDIEDEGEVSIRNKSIFLLLQFTEHQKYHKKSKQFMRQYISAVIGNAQNITNGIKNFLSKYKLPEQMLKIEQIYTQSALFMTTSFITDLFAGKTGDLSTILGNMIKQSSPQAIDTIQALLILSKCLKNQNAATKAFYLNFLREMVYKFSQNIGMLIAIARGIYEFAPQNELFISNEKNKGIPAILVSRLSDYLLRDDSAQDQSAYLVLQFWVHLLKHEPNRAIMQQMISFEKQVHYLKQYLDKGMSSVVMISFTEKLANPLTLAALYKQIENGYGKDENISTIISKCIKNKTISINQNQILVLCRKYEHKIDLVSKIIAAFLDTSPLENSELKRFLSVRTKQEWLPGLLKQGKLQNIQEKLIEYVNKITNEIQSPEELQNALLLPYFSIFNDVNAVIDILDSQQILIPFFQKLYRYAPLFKGTHLKIITAHIFISLAEKMPELSPKVIELIKGYGKIESSDWQDEEMGMQDDFNQGVLDKIFSKIVNDNVEEVFKNAFGELAWDSKRLYDRLSALESIK